MSSNGADSQQAEPNGQLPRTPVQEPKPRQLTLGQRLAQGMLTGLVGAWVAEMFKELRDEDEGLMETTAPEPESDPLTELKKAFRRGEAEWEARTPEDRARLLADDLPETMTPELVADRATIAFLNRLDPPEAGYRMIQRVLEGPDCVLEIAAKFDAVNRLLQRDAAAQGAQATQRFRELEALRRGNEEFKAREAREAARQQASSRKPYEAPTVTDLPATPELEKAFAAPPQCNCPAPCLRHDLDPRRSPTGADGSLAREKSEG